VKLSRDILLIGLSVQLLWFSFLASPRLIQKWKPDDCMKTIRIYGPFQFDFNCDSNLYLILADNPSLLLKDKLYIAGQSRPLYPVIGWSCQPPLGSFSSRLSQKYLSGLDKRWSIGFFPELMAFIFSELAVDDCFHRYIFEDQLKVMLLFSSFGQCSRSPSCWLTE